MKRTLSLLWLFFFGTSIFFSQTYQLQGNPVNTTGWTLIPSAVVNTDFVQLTTDLTNQVGGIKLNDPINLKYCDKWKVEFDFRIDGTGSASYGHGDGLAFWYLQNPPANFTGGGGLGIPANSTGLMVGFDIFNNYNEQQTSKVHILYGVNNGTNNNIEYNNTAGSSYHSTDLISSIPFVNPTYRHVEVNGEVDPANAANWIITVKIDGTQIVSQTFAPAGAAATMTQGYFGFSASTGAAKARHSIKNVKVYVDKVPLIQTSITSNTACPDPNTGVATVDLTTFNSQLSANPSLYNFTYYIQGSSTPIANPSNFQYSSSTTISVFVSDPSDNYCTNPDATIQLNIPTIPHNDDTIEACNVNGQGNFALTAASVTSSSTASFEYYPTLADLNAGTNEITNPGSYSSTPKDVYVKIIDQGCYVVSKITLVYFPLPTVNDDELEACSDPANEPFGTFDLTSADVTNDIGVSFEYYLNQSSAINGTNPISNPDDFYSMSSIVYIKVVNSDGCGAIAKVTLKVKPPIKSSILVNQSICIEDRTTLDAGSGFDAYLWSTGATTPSISGVGVGTYWVELTSGTCVAKQFVSVIAAQSPIITKVEIKNNTAMVFVENGNPPYEYSVDGVTWQTSNVFTNLPRGENIFYVKDTKDCVPVSVQVTVPNFINAITANDDGINDFIDYSALSYKKDFTFLIYDRYGTLINTIDNKDAYKWNARSSGGKRVPTGTYWYHINWTENDGTPVNYTGWILVKNKNQ